MRSKTWFVIMRSLKFKKENIFGSMTRQGNKGAYCHSSQNEPSYLSRAQFI